VLGLGRDVFGDVEKSDASAELARRFGDLNNQTGIGKLAMF